MSKQQKKRFKRLFKKRLQLLIYIRFKRLTQVVFEAKD
jgi:hypothetical protein